MRTRSTTRNLAYTALSVAIMAVMSQLSIPIGAVPLSLGIMGVFLVSGILGLGYGTLAVGVYIAMGAIGLPVFAGFKGGLGALLGATGGFILGYLFIPIIIGIICKYTKYNHITLAISMIISLMVTYLTGTLWFMNYLACGFKKALMSCVVPFILPDLLKICVADFLIIRLRKVLRITTVSGKKIPLDKADIADIEHSKDEYPK